MTETRLTVERLTRILGTSFLVAASFLLFWFLFYLIAADVAFSFQARLFNVSREQYDAMNYYGMGLLKLLTFVLFLIPYIALKISGRRTW